MEKCLDVLKINIRVFTSRFMSGHVDMMKIWTLSIPTLMHTMHVEIHGYNSTSIKEMANADLSISC